MPRAKLHSKIFTTPIISIGLFLMLFSPCSPRESNSEDGKKAAVSWTASQVIRPEELARLLDDKSASLPTIVYVGPHTLFVGGHIPGAVFHGAAANEQSLAELRKWAESLPRSSAIVLYCGCCPFEKCPNIRPAFGALNAMGFQKLQILMLPTSFVKDWVERGYPVQKGT
jgi:thiosulfate/3-mercaptopyruvate sulfurtransferase